MRQDKRSNKLRRDEKRRDQMRGRKRGGVKNHDENMRRDESTRETRNKER